MDFFHFERSVLFKHRLLRQCTVAVQLKWWMIRQLLGRVERWRLTVRWFTEGDVDRGFGSYWVNRVSSKG